MQEPIKGIIEQNVMHKVEVLHHFVKKLRILKKNVQAQLT